MAESFTAQVAAWANAVEGAHEAIFKESVQRLVTELNTLVPVGDTAFLRSSLQASSSAMPSLVRENPGIADSDYVAEITLVIAGTELGETIYLGYTAKYAARRHYGFVGADSLGRTYSESGKPWVTMSAQRWPAIVAAVEAETMARLSLN